MTNPLVRRLAAARKLDVSAVKPGPEGYVVDVRPDGVLVAGSDEAGAFYGLQSLRQLIGREGKDVVIKAARIRDWPYKPFRGVKLYLPGRENLAWFRRFVAEFMAPNKYNKMVLEVNAAMRFDKNPELNAGWLDLARDLNATRRERPLGPHGNMSPGIQNYERRSARKSVMGGAPSSWAATTEFNFGKDLMRSLLSCANMLWSTSWTVDSDTVAGTCFVLSPASEGGCRSR